MQHRIKNGLGGSRNGRGRYANTETLKQLSKKRRRAEGKAACRQ